MMGFKGEEEEEHFVECAAETGDLNINNMDNNGMELVSNVHLAGECICRLSTEIKLRRRMN